MADRRYYGGPPPRDNRDIRRDDPRDFRPDPRDNRGPIDPRDNRGPVDPRDNRGPDNSRYDSRYDARFDARDRAVPYDDRDRAPFERDARGGFGLARGAPARDDYRRFDHRDARDFDPPPRGRPFWIIFS